MADVYAVVGQIDPDVAAVASFQDDTIVVEREDREWLLARPKRGDDM